MSGIRNVGRRSITIAALVASVSFGSLTLAQDSTRSIVPGSSGSRPAPGARDATDADTRTQIRAATWDAIHSLRQDIESRSIDDNLTVGELINKLEVRPEWGTSLRKAEQIGGPRWLDAQTCQVKLEIDGERVARALVTLTQSHASASPLPAEALATKLAEWKRQSFTATGSSVRADRAIELRAPDSGAWRDVDAATRRKLITAARDAAINRVLDSVKNIQLAGTDTIGSLLGLYPRAAEATRLWLTYQPATSVRFNESNSRPQVSYALSLNGDDLFEFLITQIRQDGGAISSDSKLAAARESFRMTVGESSVVGKVDIASLNSSDSGVMKNASKQPETATTQNATAANTSERVSVPSQPPGWVFQQINAEAGAAFTGSPLRTRETAEDRATEDLRGQLNALTLNSKTTVGDAAKADPRIRRAVERAMRRASVYKVTYDSSNGSVSVKMMLDPRDFWFAIDQ